MNTPPKIIECEELQTAVIHLTVPRANIADVIDVAVSELTKAFVLHGSHPAGPLYSFHWQPPTDTFDFEVGFPVSQSIQPTGRIKMSRLPAGRVATTIYKGRYEGLAVAWSKFCGHLEAGGLMCGKSSWEYYLVGAESADSPEEFVTQLFKPLA